MPCLIVNEIYDSLNALYKNAGRWVDAEAEFSIRFSVGSGDSNKLTYYNQGNNYYLVHDSGDFADYGFVDGDSVTITWTQLGAPPMYQSQSESATISYISGNIMYLTAALTVDTPGGTFDVPDMTVFPLANQRSGMLIVADRAPDAIEFQFNLAPNGTSSLGSVIDGTLNRFLAQDVQSMSPAGTQNMTQIGLQSGGLIKDVILTYISSDGDGWRRFKIDYTFYQWGVIQDGFDEPDYYDNADCLAPIVKLRNFAQYGNANGIIEAISQNVQANTGGFDENFNGGVNNYALQSISWLDLNGDPIDALDYSNPCTFTAILDAPNQVNPDSTYTIGLLWRPIDATIYQGLATNLGQNLMVLAPEDEFIADASSNPGPYLGYTHPSGARWDFSNLKFEITAANELTITGKITPNAAAQTLFDQYGDDERKSTLYVSIANYNLSAINSDRVSLKLFDEDNIDAPTLGVDYPDHVDEYLYDHNDNDITNVARSTTTEDDVRYKARLLLTKNTEYEGIRVRIFARNSSTEDEFTLETPIFFDFSNIAYIAGIHEVNETVNRGFNLPALSDRNIISLIRDNTLDTGAKYGLALTYGYLNNWRYWLAESAVDNDFFDVNEPNDGKNKDWERYSESGNWDLYIGYYVKKDGVEDYHEYKFVDRPYEDNAYVTCDPGFTVLSTGQTPTNLPADELVQIDVVFIWSAGSFLDEWTEIRVEDKEGNTLGVISSRWDQVNEPNNPLKPITGQAKLYNVIGPANVLTASCYIDTHLVNVNEISISYRVYSAPKETDLGHIVNYTDEAHLACGLIKLADNSVYSDVLPCIEIYRVGDAATQDIGFEYDGNGWLALDTTALLDFVNELGADTGLVRTVYDQSGFSNNLVQTDLNLMPKIVDAGSLVVDVNNLPAMLFDGIDDYFALTTPIANDLQMERYLELWGLTRANSGIQNVSLAEVGAGPFVLVWDAADDIRDYMGASSGLHALGDTSRGEFIMSTFRDASGQIKAWKNDTALTTTSGAPQVNSITQFGSYAGANFNDGLVNTVVLYTSDREADRAAFVNILNAYYGYF